MKVGFTIIVDKRTKEKRKMGYTDVQYDADKWADAKRFLPADYDLMYLKSPDHIKTIPGWSTGTKWDGLNLKTNASVLYWKKHD